MTKQELEADNARLRDLVVKFQRGGRSDLYQRHGASVSTGN